MIVAFGLLVIALALGAYGAFRDVTDVTRR